MRVTRWMGWSIIILVVSFVCCNADEEKDTLLRRLVWETATRSLDPGMPCPVSQLTEVLNQLGIERNSLKPILVQYAQGNNLPKEFGSHVAEYATQVLVDWRCSEILPILIQRATAEIDVDNEIARNSRNAALAMIMRMGGEKALELAKSAINNPLNYGELERFYIYENLAKHLVMTSAPDEEESFRAAVVKLFDSNIQNEVNSACVEIMDKALAVQSVEYKKSERRKNILIKQQNTDLPYQRKYFREALILHGGIDDRSSNKWQVEKIENSHSPHSED
jgi:hypothetical protein